MVTNGIMSTDSHENSSVLLGLVSKIDTPDIIGLYLIITSEGRVQKWFHMPSANIIGSLPKRAELTTK
jgi:hypothetical protein